MDWGDSLRSRLASTARGVSGKVAVSSLARFGQRRPVVRACSTQQKQRVYAAVGFCLLQVLPPQQRLKIADPRLRDDADLDGAYA